MIKLYDEVLLQDGREGCVVDISEDGKVIYVDIGLKIGEFDSVVIGPEGIVRVIDNNK